MPNASRMSHGSRFRETASVLVRHLDLPELADCYALDGHQQALERQIAVLTTLAAAAAS